MTKIVLSYRVVSKIFMSGFRPTKLVTPVVVPEGRTYKLTEELRLKKIEIFAHSIIKFLYGCSSKFPRSKVMVLILDGNSEHVAHT